MGPEFDTAICTDAACPFNPGPVEYRGVRISTGDELFFYGPYQWWSVNIAEFLAIVEGIKIIENDDVIYPSLPWPYTLYSDSKIALSRVKKWKINTQITKNSTNALLFKKVEQAEERLHCNKQRSEFVILKKRPTSQRGHIPADFGRK